MINKDELKNNGGFLKFSAIIKIFCCFLFVFVFVFTLFCFGNDMLINSVVHADETEATPGPIPLPTETNVCLIDYIINGGKEIYFGDGVLSSDGNNYIYDYVYINIDGFFTKCYLTGGDYDIGNWTFMILANAPRSYNVNIFYYIISSDNTASISLGTLDHTSSPCEVYLSLYRFKKPDGTYLKTTSGTTIGFNSSTCPKFHSYHEFLNLMNNSEGCVNCGASYNSGYDSGYTAGYNAGYSLGFSNAEEIYCNKKFEVDISNTLQFNINNLIDLSSYTFYIYEPTLCYDEELSSSYLLVDKILIFCDNGENSYFCLCKPYASGSDNMNFFVQNFSNNLNSSFSFSSAVFNYSSLSEDFGPTNFYFSSFRFYGDTDYFNGLNINNFSFDCDYNFYEKQTDTSTNVIYNVKNTCKISFLSYNYFLDVNDFDLTSYNEGYNAGYTAGYNAGYTAGYSAGFGNGYDTGVTDTLNGFDTLKNLLFSIVDAPFIVLGNAFDFTIFGINLSNFLIAIVSLLLVGFVIRKIL